MVFVRILSLLSKLIGFFNLSIIKRTTLEKLIIQDNLAVRREQDINFLFKFRKFDIEGILDNFKQSKSQLRQDLFVLALFDFKRSGYFVEFGATDGVSDSNTYLLEKKFAWNGILSEPARCWEFKLKSNRNVNIDNSCVWSKSNEEIEFLESKFPAYSTINQYANVDMHASRRRDHAKNYSVKTISLLDLLNKYMAPHDIDFLSIDTEGSEFEILNAFDFTKYYIKVIVCEHNFSSNRSKIYDLLTHHGYQRVLEECSYFDDWYVREEVLELNKSRLS